jgi:hypothetical protein
MSVRDELPDEIDTADIAETIYKYLVMTELTWPPLFMSTWAAFEPE